MSLEGRLRELGLPEVLQLLTLSRKTGILHLEAPLLGRAARIHLSGGAVTDARLWARIHEVEPPLIPRMANEAREVEAIVLNLLLWHDGAFRFVAGESQASANLALRLSAESILVQAAQRAEVWERIAAWVPDARVIMDFADVEPLQLPLLRLAPQQWEILTRVDGTRDLTALAESLQRDLLEVAEAVAGLVEAGVLRSRENVAVPRRNSTPPAVFAIPLVAGSDIDDDPPARRAPTVADEDLWIPHVVYDEPDDPALPDDNSLFDPMRLGVQMPDGMPRRHTPLAPMRAVASPTGEPSISRESSRWPAPDMDGATLCSLGDEAARGGDLAGALVFWNAALRAPEPVANTERVREVIALATRLHGLLRP